MRRTTAAAMSIALATGAAACSPDGTLAGPEAAGPSAPAGMLVSNPTASSTSASQAAAPGSFAASAIIVAYLSALPGTFSNAISVAVRNDTRRGVPKSVLIIDGGFDPFGIEAAAGDELSLALNLVGGGPALMTVTVPRRRPPEVVRTTPIKGRSDVALNAQIAVVFSEPVDRSSINPLSVALLQDGKPVKGRLQVSGDGLRAEFIPDSLLRPKMTYSLEVGQGVRDMDGDALSAALSVAFTTEPIPPAGQLLFTQLSDRQIYSINVDGTGMTRLTSTGSGNYGPSWSPDGRRIAFAKATNGPDNRGFGTSDIYLMDANGSNVIRRTVNAFFWSTAWSPDGRKLLVSDEEVYDAHIHVMNADDDGSRPALLMKDGRSPAWSPDGQKIAYVHTSGDDGYHQVYLMNADGKGARPLTELDPGGIFGVTWSPNGERIAFSKCLGGRCDIYVMAADGSGAHPITNIGNAGDAAWSPDGASIAFTMSNYSGREWMPSLAYIPAEGGTPRVIAAGGFGPAWRPASR